MWPLIVFVCQSTPPPASNWLGRMYLHTTVLLPVCIGNLWGFAMPASVNSMFADYLAIMVMEAFYRSDETPLLRWVKRSSVLRTALFMAMSAFILNTHRSLKTDVVWFVQSFRKRAADAVVAPPTTTMRPESGPSPASPLFDRWLPVAQHVCGHPGSCDAYVLQGVQNNLKIGVTIELVRFLVENMMRLRRSPALLIGVFGQIKVRVISFFIGYTTVYRVSVMDTPTVRPILTECVSACWARLPA